MVALVLLLKLLKLFQVEWFRNCVSNWSSTVNLNWSKSLFRPEVHLDPRPSFKPTWMLDRSTESAQMNLLHISTNWWAWAHLKLDNIQLFLFYQSHHSWSYKLKMDQQSSLSSVHILFENCLVSNVMQLRNLSFVLLHWLLPQQKNYHQSYGLCDQRRLWWPF